MKPKIQLLGIVNLTDDSYYAPSRAASCEAFMNRVRQMAAEGADIIDIGACSTRPGSQPVGAEEEWRRLKPALEALRSEFPELPVSIDTYWASVVEKTYDLIGPFMVNDISAGAYDAEMLPLVGRLGLPYIAMHLRGTPETMQSMTDYPQGVTAEVLRYFKAFAKKAAKAGVRDWILDPGFGFAKTVEQNWTLLEELDILQVLQMPILVGISRKSMIYKRFGITPEESLPATQVAHYMALQRGATYLRVHDVAEARRT
ncbi:MAG: dihydropteroate synthase, partial [Bacteroidales bacterium]|nr:dihydropteroate synthase [Bacteroidales bacterium]